MEATLSEGLTRRTCLAALGGLQVLAAKPAVWSDERLGVVCHLGRTEAAARKVLAAARDAGYRRVQADFPWNEVSETFLRSLLALLKEAGIEAPVLSAYVNCVDPARVIMSTRASDFAHALDYAGTLGSTHLVAWTGGYGAGLMTADPRNLQPAASEAILRFLELHLKKLEANRFTLALETYNTLACPDAPSLRRLLRRLPPCVTALMDPPNLIPIARYAQRDEVLQEMMRLLRGRIGVVHLKDFRLPSGAAQYDLPGPMMGELNYPVYAAEILKLPVGVPIIAEHLEPGQFAAARARLLPVFRAAR